MDILDTLRSEASFPVGDELAATGLPAIQQLLHRAADEIERLRKDLDSRPRTEFVAVGWWDGQRALFEPGHGPVRGALLFRPVSGGAKL